MRYLISKSSALLSLSLSRLSSSWYVPMSCSIRWTLRSQYSMSFSGTSIIRYSYNTLFISIAMIKILTKCSLTVYAYSQLATYARRGKHRPALTISVGESVNGFIVREREFFKDFEMTHLSMEQSNGAKLHHLQCAEENNTLSLIFRTPTASKKGVNLALQKLLQCGSRRYAVRDVAVQASLRSFSRAPVAQTTDQYLMFSFNSPILKDFSNLLTVYASMLFEPLMRKQDFQEVVRRFTYDNKRLGFAGDLAEELFEGQFQAEQTVYSLIEEQLLGTERQAFCRSLDLASLSYEDVLEHYKQTVRLDNCTLLLHGDISPQYFTQQFNSAFEPFKSVNKSHFSVSSSETSKMTFPKTVNFQHLGQETVVMASYRIDYASDEEVTLLEILSYLLFDMPESPFMRFNTPHTPYPPLYGFRQRYFNIGFTYRPEPSAHVQGSVEWFREREKLLIDKQRTLKEAIEETAKKLDQKMVERCLMHLQSNYYNSNGISIIESIAGRVLEGRSLTSALQVTSLVNKLLRNFRKERTFETLIRKFLLDNPNYIVLRGGHNPHIIEYEQNRNRSLLFQMQSTLSPQKLADMAAFQPSGILQDLASLPMIAPSELESFEDLPGQQEMMGRVRTVFSERSFGNKIVVKFDLTDLGDEDIPILPLFCQAFPRMGYRTLKKESYQSLLQNYINRLEMTHQTVRDAEGGLKVFGYLSIEFTDRNQQFAFNLLNGLLNEFDHNNLMALSRAIHQSASTAFHDISQDLLHYHTLHLAASKSPFAFFQSPIFQARTLCAVAADIKKVGNPKALLMGLSRKFEQIWRKITGWSRVEVLWQCRSEKRSLYRRHLEILLKQLPMEGIRPQAIDVSSFPLEKWQKYFPNYDNEVVFEAFNVPYRTNSSPAALVLSSLINHSISNFNRIGGCFLFKGALIAFIQGNRQKYLQLEDHYRRIDDLDLAKRKIFQGFSRFTVEQQFKSGISFQQARFFKEAVIAVERQQVDAILEEHLLNSIRKGSTSQLAVGPKLQNFEPMIKKGWQIERSIDDLSLQMESLSKQELIFRPQRYIDIC